MKNIAIVVLNFNGLADTLECLASIKRLEKSGNRVRTIVVDNASADGSQEALSKLKDIDLILNDKNLGYSRGNNVGIKRALDFECEQILILNNDTTVDAKMLNYLEKAASVGDIICPKIYFAPGFEYHKDRYKKSQIGKVIWYAGAHIDWDNIMGVHHGVDDVDEGQFEKRKQIEFATGAAMYVKREVFEKIGVFDEKYFLYLEDMDFCVRAKKANFKIIFEPKAIVWHRNAGSSGSGSKLQDYYITRNRLLFASKYAKLRTKIAVLRQIAKQHSDPIKRRALFDFLTMRFGKSKVV